MRFGQKYHHLQIPQWSSSYFKYNTYKGRVRVAFNQHLETGQLFQYKGKLCRLQRPVRRTAVNLQ